MALHPDIVEVNYNLLDRDAKPPFASRFIDSALARFPNSQTSSIKMIEAFLPAAALDSAAITLKMLLRY
ncbi:hypothetical protein ACKUV4_015410 [Acinetobacter baumannii]